MRLFTFTLFLGCLSTIQGCQAEPKAGGNAMLEPEIISVEDSIVPELEPTVYAAFFDPLLADGFDFAVGDKDAKGAYTGASGKTYMGWYIATHTAEEYDLGIHTGEDWNGNGGGNSDLGQPVYCVAKGVVIAADNYGSPWGNIVMVEHRFIENNTLRTVYSQYAHLNKFTVEIGDTLTRRQVLGTIGDGNGAYLAHLHLEIRNEKMKGMAVDYWPSSNGKDQAWVKEHYEDASAFINAHRTLLVPEKEAAFIFVKKSEFQMHFFIDGQHKQTFEIALSQTPIGHKVEQGDNRLPEGHYNIIQKSQGPFPGDMGPFFGTGWMRLNYPNPFDTEAGYHKEWITQRQRVAMINAWNMGKEPSKGTRLGGGIGIHGWNGDWSGYGTRSLTWGCISMHNPDLTEFYDDVPKGTPILIVP
jgi:murein DD-endopeptidase MepM/ murein hydrolase activator NlpD